MKRRPANANVVATLALVIAIGGSTVAGASSLMTGRDIQDDSVTGADIQNGSLTGADIRPGSIGSNSLSHPRNSPTAKPGVQMTEPPVASVESAAAINP